MIMMIITIIQGYRGEQEAGCRQRGGGNLSSSLMDEHLNKLMVLF